MNNVSVIVLAAGSGKRMKSNTSKVLHRLGETPLLGWVLNTIQHLETKQTLVVIGYRSDEVREAFKEYTSVTWVHQDQQLGTGHAVAHALPLISDDNIVLILYGDVPLVRIKSLIELISLVSEKQIGLLTVNMENPTGYGRIVRHRDLGNVIRIVEEKDATPEEKLITELNTGIMAFEAQYLKKWIKMLKNDNAQGEYYLTDVIELARKDEWKVNTIIVSDANEVTGVNSPEDLARLEEVICADLNNCWT